MKKLTDFKVCANPRNIAILTLFVLAGCTAGPWEREFWHPPAASGVVPIADGQKTYPIERLGRTEGDWPELGDVPTRPTKPEVDFDEQTKALEADQTEAEAAAAAARGGKAASGAVKAVPMPAAPPALPAEISAP